MCIEGNMLEIETMNDIQNKILNCYLKAKISTKKN